MGVLDGSSELLLAIADALDEVAASCRPQGDPFTNPAKALAVEFAEALPLIAGAGPLASVAARLTRDAVQLDAGVPAVAVALPDGVAIAGSLLRGESPEEIDELTDFFRDRIADAPTRPRLLTIGDEPDPEQPGPGRAARQLAARRPDRPRRPASSRCAARYRVAARVTLFVRGRAARSAAGSVRGGFGLRATSPRPISRWAWASTRRRPDQVSLRCEQRQRIPGCDRRTGRQPGHRTDQVRRIRDHRLDLDCSPRECTRSSTRATRYFCSIGGKRSRRQATAEHPFGYGRDRYVYGFSSP